MLLLCSTWCLPGYLPSGTSYWRWLVDLYHPCPVATYANLAQKMIPPAQKQSHMPASYLGQTKAERREQHDHVQTSFKHAHRSVAIANSECSCRANDIPYDMMPFRAWSLELEHSPP